MSDSHYCLERCCTQPNSVPTLSKCNQILVASTAPWWCWLWKPYLRLPLSLSDHCGCGRSFSFGWCHFLPIPCGGFNPAATCRDSQSESVSFFFLASWSCKRQRGIMVNSFVYPPIGMATGGGSADVTRAGRRIRWGPGCDTWGCRLGGESKLVCVLEDFIFTPGKERAAARADRLLVPLSRGQGLPNGRRNSDPACSPPAVGGASWATIPACCSASRGWSSASAGRPRTARDRTDGPAAAPSPGGSRWSSQAPLLAAVNT